MDELLKRFCPRIEFDSYRDFCEHFTIEVPEDFNFAHDVMDEWARLKPDAPGLVWMNDDFEEKTFTFSQIREQSDRAANVFRSLGVGKGDSVLVILKQRPEVWFTLLGLHKLGAVAIPATFQLTQKDIEYRCRAADVKAVAAVDDEGLMRYLELALPHCPTVQVRLALGSRIPEGWQDYRKLLDGASPVWTRVPNRATDRMLMYFTSGTSSLPKMVWHDYSYPLGHIVTARYWQRVQEGGRHMTQADSGWAKFAWGKIYGQWICGAVIAAYDTERFDAEKMCRAIEKLKLTTFCAPPTIYRFLIKEDLTRFDFSTIRHCSIAGEPLNPEVYYRFKEQTGLAVTEGFGQTEGTVILANFPWDPVKPGSTGMPNPIYDLDIVDGQGKSCEDGEVGLIVVKNTDKKHPTGLFRGYWRNQQATDACWQDGIYSTGDMAWRDGDGYFWFVGRNDDVIKCSGYRIGPFEVESALMEHPAVLECAVTAAPDPVRGQVVKATVVLARGWEPSAELVKTLQNHVKKTTAPYKYPRIVEFVEELPKTTSGKIRRVEIRQRDSQKN